MTTSRLAAGLGFLLSIVCPWAAPVLAQDYPTKTIQLIVPTAPGGPTDVVARTLAQAMGARLNQTIVVEHRSGAGSILGTNAVATAAPDGYTLGLMPPGPLVAVPFMTTVPYNVQRDLAPITLVAQMDGVIVTGLKSGFKSMGEMIAYARSNPGKVYFGSAGSGTTMHLAGELINVTAGIKLVHVPYRGAAPAVNDVLGGHVHLAMPALTAVLEQVRSNTLIPLAVMSEKRSLFLPDTPTTAEVGLPQVRSSNWYGLVAPSRTPAAIQRRIHEAATAALRSPEVLERFKAVAAIAMPSSPEQFAAIINDEQARWKNVIELTGVKAE